MATIIYTYTDEAPRLATYSFLPIVSAYAEKVGVEVETRDISLAGRILAQFGLADDALSELGELTEDPAANIIKLPNISASVPQLKAAIKELQGKGYALPDYPEAAATPDEVEIRAKYGKAIGSVVNPVLRQGNSDRRAPLSVKAYARKHPHVNKPFAAGSKTTVATMGAHDFKANEKSVTLAADDTLTIVLETTAGERKVLLASLPVLAGEVVDATVLQVANLRSFLINALATAKAEDVLFSVHLKATMMKVSDPIIFGHVVKAYFARRLRRSTATTSPRRACRPTTASARSWPGCRRCRTGPRSRRRSRPRWPRARGCPTSTPTRGSPTCTCRAT